MPVRLPFIVVACTGEDPDYPCRELQFGAPESRGWCTPRFCQYPQQIVLRLDQPAQLTQIQLLSHEFKIAAKVEIHVGLLPEGGGADLGTVPWKRLGHLSFDTNERSQLSARELKSVMLAGVPAQLVRFQFVRCHANRLNVYNQVGLIALNLIGDPLGLSPGAAGAAAPLTSITNTAAGLPPGAAMAPHSLAGMASLNSSGGGSSWGSAAAAAAPSLAAPYLGKSVSSAAASGGGAAGLAAELNVDVVTAQKILELQEQKKQAIDREDYDEAKRLKSGIDKLRAVGTKIAQLEGRKKVAVEQEDYDLAKELKMEVDRLRSIAYASALSGEGSGGGGDVYNSFKSPVPSRRVSGSAAMQPGRRASDSGAAADEGPFSPPQGVASSRGYPLAAESSGGMAAAAPAAQRSRVAPGGSESWANYDERPAQAKGVYSFEGDAAAAPAPSRRVSGQAAGRAAAGGNAPPGFPADLPAPEELFPADSKDAQPLVELLGEYTTRALFSKTWQLREAALQKLAGDVSSGTLEALDGNGEALRTLVRCAARLANDKVAGVFQAALRALRELLGAQASKCQARDVQAAVAELLPVLVDKACDLNARIKEQATELLVYLAGVKQAGLGANNHPFVKPLKPTTSWKVVLGRLQLLSALLPALGVAGGGKGGGGGDGFQLDAVMDFVAPAFSNSSAEVRGAAVALTLQVFDAVGPSVQRYLPSDLKPQIRESIEQGMLGRGSPGAAGGAGGSGSAAKAGRPPAPKSAAPAKRASAAASGKAPLATPPAQQQQQQQFPGSPGSPGALPLSPGADDPTPFEAELRACEARLGPSHPDVAEALSNLAIVHNQRGDTSRALPLYERALAIWEASCGGDHPDVAHTLTDIAVIHLEQGRDDIGRPLLERALAIQEKHLGPDHPDVVAIRDVLNEE